MTQEQEPRAGIGVVIFIILKVLVAIGPQLSRSAPDIARAVPPPRSGIEAVARGADGGVSASWRSMTREPVEDFDADAFLRAVDEMPFGQIGEVPVSDLVDIWIELEAWADEE